jgi:hypothetical protein
LIWHSSAQNMLASCMSFIDAILCCSSHPGLVAIKLFHLPTRQRTIAPNSSTPIIGDLDLDLASAAECWPTITQLRSSVTLRYLSSGTSESKGRKKSNAFESKASPGGPKAVLYFSRPMRSLEGNAVGFLEISYFMQNRQAGNF